jgi:hypothetical protein
MTLQERALTSVAWFVAVVLLLYFGFLAYFMFMPFDNWLTYHSVRPLKSEFEVDEVLKFISHTDLHRDSILTFNDIVFCLNDAGEFERYDSQNTKRLHAAVDGQKFDRYTIWPFSPGVTHPAICYLESNINLHLPLNVDRSIRYDGQKEGHLFTIVPKEEPK